MNVVFVMVILKHKIKNHSLSTTRIQLWPYLHRDSLNQPSSGSMASQKINQGRYSNIWSVKTNKFKELTTITLFKISNSDLITKSLRPKQFWVVILKKIIFRCNLASTNSARNSLKKTESVKTSISANISITTRETVIWFCKIILKFRISNSAREHWLKIYYTQTHTAGDTYKKQKVMKINFLSK